MKHLSNTLYVFLWLLGLLMGSCTDEEVVQGPQALGKGQTRFSVRIPEPRPATRTLGDTPQSVTAMPMHVLVFDENGFFIAFQEATVDSFNDGAQEGTYTVSLPPSGGEKRILHFVLGTVQWDTYLPTQSEVDIFSSLSVSDGQDVYWQRMEVDDIPDPEPNKTLTLPEVSLVRNFAKITVETTADTNSEFSLLGFDVVNETTAGTVAPYVGTEGVNGGFARFNLDEATTGTTAYERFRALNDNYGGNNAGEVDDELPDENTGYTLAAKYVYERNQDEASRPACILLKANYNGNECYYKLDLVETDEKTWITSYLNLYRNFQYTVRIGTVTGAGYDTAEEAMNAAASNNIGASVEVSEVNTIQDGTDQLYVSTLDTLLVSNDEAKIYYEFRKDINVGGGTVNNDRVIITPVGGPDNGWNLKAIKGYRYDNGTLYVTPAAKLPNNWIEEQEFMVTVERSQLSRRIVVRVRHPFRFDAVDCEELVPEEVGERVTLVVRLPENMPASVFPLTLRIEPRRKTIYPDASGGQNIPVSTDKPYTFSYLATVTREQYQDNYTQYFTFLTNVASSQTYITVTNPYFEDESTGFDYVWNIDRIDIPYNVTFFRNDPRFDFFNVELSSEGNGTFSESSDGGANKGTFTFDDYNPIGANMTLSFNMHREDDGYDTTQPHDSVEIYIDYGANIQSTTGRIKLDEARNRIIYWPNNALGKQEITFTINEYFATETIQLSSYDHETATVTYTPPSPVRVRVQYGNRTLQNEEVSIYDSDRYNNNSLIGSIETDRSGYIEIPISYFRGYTPGTTLYFRYRDRGMIFTTNYDGSATIQQLLNGETIQLTRSR